MNDRSKWELRYLMLGVAAMTVNGLLGDVMFAAVLGMLCLIMSTGRAWLVDRWAFNKARRDVRRALGR